jgi:membrane protein implicated in regulation of membrane protease activity
VSNWVNWTLVILGVVSIIAELMLGAITGFDLALIGAAMVVGGGIGLFFASTKIGLASAGVLALIYLAFFRRWLKHKLTVKEHPSNVDAIVGRNGVVLVRIAPHVPGQIKVGDEVWRAELARESDAAREPGEKVTVDSVEGVTLKVR